MRLGATAGVGLSIRLRTLGKGCRWSCDWRRLPRSSAHEFCAGGTRRTKGLHGVEASPRPFGKVILPWQKVSGVAEMHKDGRAKLGWGRVGGPERGKDQVLSAEDERRVAFHAAVKSSNLLGNFPPIDLVDRQARVPAPASIHRKFLLGNRFKDHVRVLGCRVGCRHGAGSGRCARRPEDKGDEYQHQRS